MKNKNYQPATLVVHQGTDRDPYTGAATVPIYQSSTYHHPGGEQGEYEYSRGNTPNRAQVEEALALLEGGTQGFAYASGMAAIGSALALLCSGDHLIVPDDLYGGSYRYLTRIIPDLGIDVTFVDFCDLNRVEDAVTDKTRGIFIETPSNPQFQITDIRGVVEIARQKKILTFLDNTFMTPLLQRPLELGVDVSIHSATKFLGGHSDILAGVNVTADPVLAKRLRQFQNGFGAVLAPFDCFLLSRGLKTLKVRLEAAQASAGELARRLADHPAVARTLYPGLDGFADRDLHFSQADGPGAVLSFELKDRDKVKPLLETIRLPIIAPSLGGVESILTHCWSMSHAAIPAEVKNRLGISERLLRLSVGIEDIKDLWDDLDAALV